VSAPTARRSYHLVCVESYDLHWSNEAAQPSNFELYCVPA
jgi:hypothetical protein